MPSPPLLVPPHSRSVRHPDCIPPADAKKHPWASPSARARGLKGVEPLRQLGITPGPLFAPRAFRESGGWLTRKNGARYDWWRGRVNTLLHDVLRSRGTSRHILSSGADRLRKDHLPQGPDPRDPGRWKRYHIEDWPRGSWGSTATQSRDASSTRRTTKAWRA